MQNKIFQAQNVVFCGSQKNKDSSLATVHRNLKKSFEGEIFVTKSKSKTGIYQSVSQVLDPLDLAVIKMPVAEMVGALRECGEQEIKTAIVLGTTSGRSVFTRQLKQKITAIGARYGMQILGPRSAGCLDTHSERNFSIFAMPKRGHLSVISQSSSRTENILNYLKKSEYGVSKVFTLGEKSGLTELELLLELDQDKNTRVILLCLESISDGKNFFSLIKNILKRKEIILCPTGSLAGQKFSESKDFVRAKTLGVNTVKRLPEILQAMDEQGEILTQNKLRYRLQRWKGSLGK